MRYGWGVRFIMMYENERYEGDLGGRVVGGTDAAKGHGIASVNAATLWRTNC